jgi:hypothetical protein
MCIKFNATYSVTWKSRWSYKYLRTMYVYAPLVVDPMRILDRVGYVHAPGIVSAMCLERVEESEGLPVHYAVGIEHELLYDLCGEMNCE